MERNEEISESVSPYILRFIVSSLADRRRTEETLTNNDQSQIVSFLLNRVRPTNTNSTNEETEELSAIERRARRRRFTFLDEAGESEDELINPKDCEEYIDFRTYPLTINWRDIYSTSNDSCIYIVFLITI